MVESELSPIVRDFEHIVLGWIDIAVSHSIRSFSEAFHNILLHFRRRKGDVGIDDLRHGEL